MRNLAPPSLLDGESIVFGGPGHVDVFRWDGAAATFDASLVATSTCDAGPVDAGIDAGTVDASLAEDGAIDVDAGVVRDDARL